MKNWTICLIGFGSVFAATSAVAGGPLHRVSQYGLSQDNSRSPIIGNSASAASCTYASSGQVSCASVYFVETYTVHVAYEFTELSVFSFTSGPETNGNRSLHCYVPKDSMSVTKAKGATVSAVLDTESPSCDYNYGVSCDGNYANCVDMPYSGVFSVSGAWWNPSSDFTSATTNKSRDLVTGVASTSHCNLYLGSGVRNGYFSVSGSTFVIDNIAAAGGFTLSKCVE